MPNSPTAPGNDPRSYLPAEIRERARRYTIRSGNGDVLDAMGLDDLEVVPRAPGARGTCPMCGNPLPDPMTNGGYKRCRRVKCQPEKKDE